MIQGVNDAMHGVNTANSDYNPTALRKRLACDKILHFLNYFHSP